MKHLLTVLIFFSLVGSAWANCNDSINDYNTAVNEIFYRLKKYAACVEASKGQDDCYSEFRKLKWAQDSFESAVTNYKFECE